MFQLAYQQLDHYGVVEKADARNVIRDEIFRLGEIGQGVEYTGRFGARQAPFVILQHLNHDLQLAESLRDEARHLGLPNLSQQFLGAGDDILRCLACCSFA